VRTPEYCAAIDQGTTSTRCVIFDRGARAVGVDQKEHEQVFPQSGWVEHRPAEIWEHTQQVVKTALANADLALRDLAAVGITNQRETTVVWDRHTGRPLYNAIVWQDTRSGGICQELGRAGGQGRFRERTGLPLSPYFSGTKLRWLLDHVPGLSEAAEGGSALFGTIDSFLVWWLTGGPAGGVHVTDPTNASRTLLMDLATSDWDPGALDVFGIPRRMLPEIHTSSEVYGIAQGALSGVPVAGILGDQQAALVGQGCLSTGEAKNTYGTGCFLLLNTGTEPVHSRSGLLTTVAYQLGREKPAYALEGSVAIAGALVQWLRDNLGLIERSADMEALANTVADNGGIYFVPAFSGLFAPYWRDSARGVIVGLTRYVNKGHVARETLEATTFQTLEVVEAMKKDSGIRMTSLRVDGGMVHNETLMQFQADLLGLPLMRARLSETTALGAAYAAGLAVGFWNGVDDLPITRNADRVWHPHMDSARRASLCRQWKRAVTRSFDWIEEDPPVVGT
jgi:glycerol kinase